VNQLLSGLGPIQSFCAKAGEVADKNAKVTAKAAKVGLWRFDFILLGQMGVAPRI
jgi:hypothetical protein